MVPSAGWWALGVDAAVRGIPPTRLPGHSRTSLLAITWTLAASADHDHRISADHTAAMLARQTTVGDRVWRKRTAWLRDRGWLPDGPGGPRDGWQLTAAPLNMGS